jgi:uncharacterized protein YbjT (DUF2867 family)
MKNENILIIGATGTVGSEVVKQLVESGRKVRVLVRDPAKVKHLGKAVEVTKGDLEKPETLAPAFANTDKAFVLSTGPQLLAMETNAFHAAKKAGVKHIVKLSGRHVNADFMVGTPLSQWHAGSEQSLQTIGIPWTILRPQAFASNFLMWLDRKQSGIFLPVGDGKDSFIDPRDIAAVAVKLLTNIRTWRENLRDYQFGVPRFPSGNTENIFCHWKKGQLHRHSRTGNARGPSSQRPSCRLCGIDACLLLGCQKRKNVRTDLCRGGYPRSSATQLR